MKVIKQINDEIVLSFSIDELLVVNNTLNEVINGIEISEFETRIGFPEDMVNDLLMSIHKTLEASGSIV